MWRAKFVIIILTFFHIAIAKQNIHRYSLLNSVKEDILSEWEDKNIDCKTQLLDSIAGALNHTLGGSWLWDSLQLPSGILYGNRYQLGNFDQCFNAPWSHHGFRTKYCLADLRLTQETAKNEKRTFHPDDLTENYLNTLTKYKRELNVLTWGICVPASCDPRSVEKLLVILHRHSAVPTSSSPNVTLDYCEETGQPRAYGNGYYAFWYFILVLIFIALSSTYYTVHNENKNSSDIVSRVAKAFCIRNNAYSLVKDVNDDIKCMYGIRAVTATLTVIVHYTLFVLATPLFDGLDLEKGIDKYWVIAHASVGIETFFLMSGLLTIKGLMARRHNPENPLVVIVKRYIRFFAGLAIIVWYISSVLDHWGDGPMWSRFVGREIDLCHRNWALTLLMVNNYLNVSEICHMVTWYTSTDFQLTIFALVVFHWCCRARGGRGLVAALAVFFFLLPGVMTYLNKWPADLLPDYHVLTNIRECFIFAVKYTRTHFRAGPYMVGMGFGYFLSVYKPAEIRNILTKKWTVVLTTMAFTSLYLVAGSGGKIFLGREYNAMEAALFAATSRIVWAFSTGAIIVLCEYGPPNVYSNFFSWQAWVPLSRLSYGVYLIHPILIYYSVFTSRTPLSLNGFLWLMYGLGVACLAYVSSLCLWILVEAPFINLTNMVLPRSGTRTPVEEDKKIDPIDTKVEEDKHVELKHLYPTSNGDSLRLRQRT